MSADMKLIPVFDTVTPFLYKGDRRYYPFRISAMKSGKGHDDPAASMISMVAGIVADQSTKGATTVNVYVWPENGVATGPIHELKDAIKTEYRPDTEDKTEQVSFATLQFGVISEYQNGKVMTSPDGEQWVDARFTPNNGTEIDRG